MSGALDRAALCADVAAHLLGPCERPDRFGVEIEVFPLRWGDPPEPVPLGTDCEPGVARGVFEWGPDAGYEVVLPGAVAVGPAGRGAFTFEPGGQVEFSCAPRETPRAAWELTRQALDGLQELLARRGLRTISAGANPWTPAGTVPLQTLAPRYECMAAYFAAIGPAGEHMMRRTGAAHVNVDLGGVAQAERRWRAAQLLSPVALATFAFSPLEAGQKSGWKSLRGRSWLELDPSRTGFPAAFVADAATDRAAAYTDFALDARVMMVRGEPWRAVLEPVTFAQWRDRGLDGLRPSRGDWDYHLSTLFPEVRAKGFLELRAADAQAEPFRGVPLAWWSALLCDDEALDAVLARLEPTRAALPARRVEAAREGPAGPSVGPDVPFAWDLAAGAVERAPERFGTELRAAFGAFGQRFATRQRCPADELEERAARGRLGPGDWDDLSGAWTEEARAFPRGE